MCIEKVTGWAYKGQYYETEQDAVWSAIDLIGKHIVRTFATNPGRGLIENPDLPKLLKRYAELAGAKDEAAPHLPEGTRSEELEGTRGDEELYRDKETAIDEMRKMGATAKQWLAMNNFDNVQDFIDHGNESHLDAWEKFRAKHEGIEA